MNNTANTRKLSFNLSSISAYTAWWLSWIIAPFSLAIITAIVYFPSLSYAFQFDDAPNILKFYNIRHLTFKQLFLSSTRWISFWLNTINYTLSEFHPFYYRLFNLAFHTTTGILLFYLLMILFRRLPITNFIARKATLLAFLTTLFFLLHPVQTQTVCYIIQGQLEGLSALFVIAILLLFVIAATSVQAPLIKTTCYALMFFMGFLSTGTKEIAIVSPFLVMLIDWFFIAQGNWHSFKQRLALHGLLFFVVMGMYCYLLKPKFFVEVFGLKKIAHNNIGNILNNNFNELITPWLFFISQFKVVFHYVLIFLWPFGLCIEYDWKLVDGLSSTDCWLPLLALISIFIGIFLVFKKNRTSFITCCALWFFICVAPRSSIIPSSELMADYKTYLASVGIFLLLAYALLHFFTWLEHKRNVALILLVGCCIPSLGILTYHQNTVWRSGLEFWGHAIKHAPRKARGYNNYGVELINQRRFKEAIPFFKKAIAMEGDSYWDPYTNLANTYAILQKFDLAINVIRSGLALNPYQPDAYNSLGVFFLQQKQFDLAEKALNAALTLVPHYGKALYNLGRLYAAKEDLEKAWLYFKKSCREADLDNESTSLQPYGELSLDLGYYEDAIFAYQRLMHIEPTSDHYFKLGVAHFQHKEYQNAAAIFEQLLKQDPHNQQILCNLCESYLALHDSANTERILDRVKQLSSPYQGVEIHEAKYLALIGKAAQARILLELFLDKQPPTSMARVARDVLQEINSHLASEYSF